MWPTSAAAITAGLLIPFWWGLALFVLALLGDALPALRQRVRRLFDALEGAHDAAAQRPIWRASAAS